MPEYRCYACDITLNQNNQSWEHIIINAAGGRLKSQKLLCKKCNSTFGNKVDSHLAKQLNVMANLLVIKRDSGQPQPIVGSLNTGEEYFLDLGGIPRLKKPSVVKSVTENRVDFSITARNGKEIKKILSEIASKHPLFELKKALEGVRNTSTRLEEPLNFSSSIGGPEVFRAVCKCAINYYLYRNGDKKYIKHLVPYLEGEEEMSIVWMHYQDNLYQVSDNECFHVIHLFGNQMERVLYAYVDYFNTDKYLILLNENYTGETFTDSYCFNLFNQSEIHRNINVSYSRQTLLDFFLHRDANPHTKVQAVILRMLGLADKRQNEFQKEKLLDEFVAETIGKYPAGTVITEEIVAEMNEEFQRKVLPYFRENHIR